MNKLLKQLTGDDLRSDGRANEVAKETLQNPQLLDKLIEGLDSTNKVVRARTAHALERISRINPEILEEYLPRFISSANEDDVPMVKWHIAMLLANIPLSKNWRKEAITTLVRLLKDESNFVKSWAISSLAILGRKNKSDRRKIMNNIKPLKDHSSASIRTREKTALKILRNEDEPIPNTWKKLTRTERFLNF